MKRPTMILTACMTAFMMLSLMISNLSAQSAWIVPDDQKGELATFKFTDEVVKKGAEVYVKNCQSCHGNPGKGNWVKLQPEPGDPAAGKFVTDSDGELFYKISAGRGAMPQFKLILGEEDRWNVIAYIRTFHKGYVQPDPELAKAAAKGGRAAIAMHYDTASGKVIFDVKHTKDNITNPAANAGILVFVKRYFGNMQIGQTRTNDKGIAAFEFPKDIPGDTAGMLAVVAKLDENSGYGSAEKTDSLRAGRPSEWVPLNEERAMWNVRAKAPLWVMLSYSIVVMGVLLTIVYILFQIRKIHHTGRAYDHPDDPMMS